MAAPVAEIFSSVQGEGLFVGHRQIFIRLCGCNLSCSYCDTVLKEDTPFCRVEATPERRNFSLLPNPLQAGEIAFVAASFGLPLHHSVSLTGGEPLLYTTLIREMAPLLKGTRRGIYLETNGTMPEALSQVIDMIDIVAMDFKLPSVTGLPPFWETHARFLEIAAKKEVFVKVVVGEETTFAEIETAAWLIKDIAAGVPLVIQPVSGVGDSRRISPSRALDLQQQALNLLSEVRVIPQTHKMMGQL